MKNILLAGLMLLGLAGFGFCGVNPQVSASTVLASSITTTGLVLSGGGVQFPDATIQYSAASPSKVYYSSYSAASGVTSLTVNIPVTYDAYEIVAYSSGTGNAAYAMTMRFNGTGDANNVYHIRREYGQTASNQTLVSSAPFVTGSITTGGSENLHGWILNNSLRQVKLMHYEIGAVALGAAPSEGRGWLSYDNLGPITSIQMLYFSTIFAGGPFAMSCPCELIVAGYNFE